MAKIYVASSWRNEWQPYVVTFLRNHGHEVYDFRNPKDGDNGFHWSEIDPQWKEWTPEKYAECLNHPIAEDGFKTDFEAMKWADVFVGVQPFGRSASIEMGWAAGNGKKTILLLDNGEPELMVKVFDHIYCRLEEVAEAIDNQPLVSGRQAAAQLNRYLLRRQNMDYFDETQEHIWEVQRNMFSIASALEMRSKKHDESKLNEPEASSFAALTPLLAESTYGSDEYNGFLTELQDTLKHHYAENRHHPEHFENGISDMTIIDLIEMFCDWLAATKRHKDGNIYKSIDINKDRFSLPEQLVSIFKNTATEIFEEKDNQAVQPMPNGTG